MSMFHDKDGLRTWVIAVVFYGGYAVLLTAATVIILYATRAAG